MVIDTSAVLAILLNEPERDAVIDALAQDPVRLMSAVNALEGAIVIEARKRGAGGREYDLLLHQANVDIVPFTRDHMEEARSAWRRFGKGNHPASLNFCDCCAYAASRLSGERLLFKGEDFQKTDVSPAVTGVVHSQDHAFRLSLHRTYFNQGFFNVPVEFGQHFGRHDSVIEIRVEGRAAAVRGRIDRKAQQNGTPRIMGGMVLRDWFRSNFKQGDAVQVTIESATRIRLSRTA